MCTLECLLAGDAAGGLTFDMFAARHHDNYAPSTTSKRGDADIYGLLFGQKCVLHICTSKFSVLQNSKQHQQLQPTISAPANVITNGALRQQLLHSYQYYHSSDLSFTNTATAIAATSPSRTTTLRLLLLLLLRFLLPARL